MMFTAEPKHKGFHLLEEAEWDETAVIPRIVVEDEDAAQPRHQVTPVMPEETPAL